MIYKVGEQVICKVQTIDGHKRLLKNKSETRGEISEESFQVLYKNETMQTYMILLPDDMPGGTLNNYHTSHLNVSRILLGKKFVDISECHILGKK